MAGTIEQNYSVTDSNVTNLTGFCVAYAYPSLLSYVINGILCPIISIATLISNVLAVTIFMKRHSRSPTTLMLTALAVSDIFAGGVLSPLFIYIYGVHADKTELILTYPFCIYHDLAYTFAAIFHANSIWLTTALGIQRYIVVAKPFSGRRICNFRKSFITIAVIFVLSNALCFLYFFYKTYDYVHYIDEGGEEHYICKCPLNMWLYEYFDGLMAFIRCIIGNIVPCGILVVSTFLLLRKLKSESKRIMVLHADENNDKERRDFRQIKRTSKMIVWIAAWFLIIEIPNGLFLLIKAIHAATGTEIGHDTELTIINILNLMVFWSYFVNFWIFLCMSEYFRNSLQKLLGFDKCSMLKKSTKDNSVLNNSETIERYHL